MKNRYLMVAALVLMPACSNKTFASGSFNDSEVDSGSVNATVAETVLTEQPAEKASLSSFESLPKDLKMHVCSFFGNPYDFGTLAQVSKFLRDFINNNIKGASILIGITGSGKSSLAYLMSNRGLVADNESPALCGHWGLRPERSALSINIEHDICAGTRQPALLIDPWHQEAIFDCCGFRDPRGEDQDVINANAIYNLLKWKARVILVESEDSFFGGRCEGGATRMNRVTAMFPDLEQLKQFFFLVLTKNDLRYEEPGRTVSQVLQYFIKEAGIPRNLTPKSRKLLEFLFQNPDRVAFFPTRTEPGTYVPRADLVTLMNNRSYLLNPTVVRPKEENVKIGGW